MEKTAPQHWYPEALALEPVAESNGRERMAAESGKVHPLGRKNRRVVRTAVKPVMRLRIKAIHVGQIGLE
jgi:hypothetical protein